MALLRGPGSFRGFRETDPWAMLWAGQWGRRGDFQFYRFGHFLVPFLHLKTPVFGFGVLCSLWVFFQFSLLVNRNGGFSDFSVQCVLRFSWICQGRYTPVALKLVLLYSLLPLLSCRGMHDKPSIFSSPYLVVTAAEQTYYEKLKITLLSCDDNKITELRVETTTKL